MREGTDNPTQSEQQATGAATGLSSGGAAMLLGVLWIAGAYATFLRYNAYPLWRLDVLSGMAILAIGPVIVGWIYGRLGSVARACLLGLFAYVVARLNGVTPGLALAAALAGGLFTFRSERAAIRSATIVAAVVLAWPLVGLSERKKPLDVRGQLTSVGRGADNPPIVHVVFDAHGGKPAFDLVEQAAPGTWSTIATTYRSLGFSIWPNAFARHFYTVNSLPEMFSFTDGNGKILADGGIAGQMTLFDRYVDAGYALHIFQSDYEDFCHGNRVSSCTTYGYASLAPVAQLPFSERVPISLGAFATMMSKTEFGARWRTAGVELIGGPDGQARVNMLEFMAKPIPLDTIQARDVLLSQVRNIRPSQAIVAHLLLPHFPYVLAPDCSTRPMDQWQVRLSDQPPAARYEAYAAQSRCALTLLKQIASAAGPNAIIVVHGDHGPRIMTRDPLASNVRTLRPADLAISYSTLFAVRLPGQAATIHDQQSPVSELLDELSTRRWEALPSAPTRGLPSAMVNDAHIRPAVSIRLPDWTAPDRSPSPSR